MSVELKNYLRLLGINLLLVLVVVGIFSLPLLSQLNNIFLDRLQGATLSREEIVIIGIDDQSLEDIGAWPWTRDIFARGIDVLSEVRPAVVGFDILFFEDRDGDSQFEDSLAKATFPVVLGSKLIDGELNESKFVDNKYIHSGYVNFVQDSDGKIRETTFGTKINGECEYSLGFAVFKQYLGVRDDVGCDKTLTLRDTTYSDREKFSFTQEGFTNYSFSDLIDGDIPSSELKGKVVLIGSTAIDLKGQVTDVFTDVLGRTIPGVDLHANIVNSLLQEDFQYALDGTAFFLLMLIVTSIVLVIWMLVKSNIVEFLILFLGIVIMNLAGVFLYDFDYNWPFMTANVLMIATYILYVVYKYFVESKEKRFIKKAFGQYINPELLDELVDKPDMLKLGGEKRNITVLFSDIRGFTSISEKLTPSELVDLTNDYFEAETNVILEHDGTIDKYIGDAIMAFWNAPVRDEDHQLLAIRAGLEMQSTLKEFNKQYPDLPDIRIGVGINTDEMIVGNIGSQTRFDYTLIGDGVNLGSRVEGLTKEYKAEVIVTENVLKDVSIEDEDFIVRILDDVMVKGKDISVKIYEVLDKNQENANLVSRSAEAFAAYQKGNFDLAIKLYSQLGDDSPAQLMVARIQGLTEEQKQNWDGTWEWKHK